jgi:hypothetical protein
MRLLKSIIDANPSATLLTRTVGYSLILAFHTFHRGAASSRFYHEHPWLYFGIMGTAIVFIIWRRF